MSETPDTSKRLKGYDDFALSLGDELRGERATLGKSLLDVQRDLRIKAAYIAAIENCDPSVFPNQGFIAGYVRSYGRYLKIDPDKMFDQFCEESGFEGVNAGMIPARKSRRTSDVTVLKGAEVAPRFDGYGTFRNESILNVISPSGIASAVVLMLLIGGLGFGGWSIVNDIQRVDFAPLDQTPLASENISSVDQTRYDSAALDEIPTVNEQGFGEEEELLGRLYRPQELAVPKLEPRDGPIAAIDPDSVGVLKPVPLPSRIPTVSEATEFLTAAISAEPEVTISASPPDVRLYATRAAWVRVYHEDGIVLFEKILEKGESYTIPIDAEKPLLRAGNSGSVYVLVDQIPYGPIGSGTSVAKQISLASIDVLESYSVADDLDLAPEVDSTLIRAGNQ